MFSLSSKKNSILQHISIILMISVALGGCVASTRVIMDEDVEIKQYGELYFISPEKDPRNLVPRVIEEFKQMGFNIKVVDPDKPMEGTQGSGFIISRDGKIITCAHVLGEEQEATTWLGGKRYEADVMYIDEGVDIAARAVTAAMQRDSASGNGIDIAIITKKEFRMIPEDEIKSRLEKFGK